MADRHPLEVIFENYDRSQFEHMLKEAAAISENDPEVVKAMEEMLDDPINYLKQKADTFEEWGIELSDNVLPDYFEEDDLLEIAMADTLEKGFYMVEADGECDIDDFFDVLEEIETYGLIAAEMPRIKNELDTDGGVEAWIERINELLDGKAYVIYRDMDTESYPLTIVSPETFAVLTEGYDGEDEDDEDGGSGIRNVIDDRDLKMQIADTALGLLVEGEDFGELANTRVEFGYLYYFEDHGIESLFKLETDKTTAYFAAQGNKLMRLNFTEELFRSTIEGFLDAHGEEQ